MADDSTPADPTPGPDEPRGDPTAGEPPTGDPTAGEPPTGEPPTGDPTAGTPTAGGDAAPGAAGTPTAGGDAAPGVAGPPGPLTRRAERLSRRADRVAARADRVAGRPAVRHLWRVGGSLAAVGMLGFGTLESVSRLAHEEETIVTELDGSGLRSVSIRNSAGPVQLVGTDDDSVTIRAEVSHGLRSTGHSERIDGDRLVLRASCPVIGSNFCEVRYRVEVPEDVSVAVTAGASITVRDVAGSVDASTGDGRVEVSRVGGDVRLESDDGPVVGQSLASPEAAADSDHGRVELSFAEAPQSVVATSDNGSVDVVVPDTRDAYVIRVSSGNGTATGTDVRTDPDSRRTITASSDNGDVTVRYP